MIYDWEKNIRTCQNGQNMVTLEGTKIYNISYTSKDAQEKTFQLFPVQPIGFLFHTEDKKIGTRFLRYILIDDAHIS